MGERVDVLAELDRRLEIGALFGQAHDVPVANLVGDETLRQARDGVAKLIAAASALAPRYVDTTTVRGRQEMGRRLRTLAAALEGVSP